MATDIHHSILVMRSAKPSFRIKITGPANVTLGHLYNLFKPISETCNELIREREIADTDESVREYLERECNQIGLYFEQI